MSGMDERADVDSTDDDSSARHASLTETPVGWFGGGENGMTIESKPLLAGVVVTGATTLGVLSVGAAIPALLGAAALGGVVLGASVSRDASVAGHGALTALVGVGLPVLATIATVKPAQNTVMTSKVWRGLGTIPVSIVLTALVGVVVARVVRDEPDTEWDDGLPD